MNIDEELKRLFGAFEIVVPLQIIEELKILLEKGRPKDQKKAKLALKLLERYAVLDVDAEDGDTAVIELARMLDGIVFSNDREIRSRARELGLRVVFVRARKHLSVE